MESATLASPRGWVAELVHSAAESAAQARLRYLFVGCVAVATASLLPFPSGLGYDAWAWIVWGRELGHLDLQTTGGPAFKPLPVLIATLISPTGHAAAALWLVAARASALFSLVLAFRLGNNAAGRLAGIFAAGTLALSLSSMSSVTLQGYTEPTLIAFVLLAIDRHLARRPGQAFLLGCLAGLGRPEVWPLLALYALAQWRAQRGLRIVFASMLLLLPAAWLVPDWLGSHGASMAGAKAADHRPLAVLLGTAVLLTVPGVAGVAGATVVALRRADGFVLALVASGLVWVAIVAVGVPDARYLMLPVAVLAVPAGIGAAWMIRAVRTKRARIALAALAAITALPVAIVTAAGATITARTYAAQLSELPIAIARAGGPDRVLSPGPPAIDPAFETALAWELKVPLSKVQRTWRTVKRTSRAPEGRARWTPPAVVFRTTDTAATGPRLRPWRRDLRVREFAWTGEWSVVLAEPARVARQ
jgi:hypothetical protein